MAKLTTTRKTRSSTVAVKQDGPPTIPTVVAKAAEPSTTVTVIPSSQVRFFDIDVGAGYRMSKHHGNLAFRALIDSSVKTHFQKSKKGLNKYTPVMKDIFNALKTTHRVPVRMLERHPTLRDQWIVMDDSFMRKKIRNAFVVAGRQASKKKTNTTYAPRINCEVPPGISYEAICHRLCAIPSCQKAPAPKLGFPTISTVPSPRSSDMLLKIAVVPDSDDEADRVTTPAPGLTAILPRSNKEMPPVTIVPSSDDENSRAATPTSPTPSRPFRGKRLVASGSGGKHLVVHQVTPNPEKKTIERVAWASRHSYDVSQVPAPPFSDSTSKTLYLDPPVEESQDDTAVCDPLDFLDAFIAREAPQTSPMEIADILCDDSMDMLPIMPQPQPRPSRPLNHPGASVENQDMTYSYMSMIEHPGIVQFGASPNPCSSRPVPRAANLPPAGPAPIPGRRILEPKETKLLEMALENQVGYLCDALKRGQTLADEIARYRQCVTQLKNWLRFYEKQREGIDQN